MKTIKKFLITVLAFGLAAGLFFSCDNSVSEELPENTATEETSASPDTTATPSGGTGGSGVSGSTGYTEPTLPASVGTDPFRGKTYSSGSTEYAFGNNGDLITHGENNNRKWQYTYNATTQELSLKLIQTYGDGGWCTYSQIVELYRSFLYSDYVNQLTQEGAQIPSEAEFNQMVEEEISYERAKFETITVYKAYVDDNSNLKVRTKYYKTAPSQLPYTERIDLSNSEYSISMRIRTDVNEDRRDEASRITIGQNPNVARFIITRVTSDTIYATEGEGRTPSTDGRQLQIRYSNLGLGNDNNIVITVTGDNDTARSLLNNSSVLLSTETGYKTYYSSTIPTYTEPTLPAGGTCPFTGTYASWDGSEEYEFGNDSTLTYSRSWSGNQQAGNKWQYSYDSTSKELSLKLTHIWMSANNGSSGEGDYLTFSQLYEFIRNRGWGDEMISDYKRQFETITVYKAEETDSNNDGKTDLNLRIKYYTTAPSRLQSKESIDLSRNSANPGISLNIHGVNQGAQNQQGVLNIYNNASSTQTFFIITNITENTISAVEAVSQVQGPLTIVPDGQQLEIRYSKPVLGDDHNVVVTLTGADTSTANYFNTIFTESSVTLSTQQNSIPYEKQ